MITVLMSVYNEPISILSQAIESILRQTYSDIEFLIIIDSPSRMDVIEYVNSINDSRINMVINEANIGLTASLNKGVMMANGEYIARMDADDYSMPDRLAKQLELLINDGLDLVGSDLAFMDNDGFTIKERVIFPRSDKLIKKLLRYNSPIPHPTWLGRTELFRNNKYIDFPACEDYELLVRLALSGKKFGNVGKVLLKYRINDNGISLNKKSIQKTCLYYIRKNYRKKKTSSRASLASYLRSANGKKKQKAIGDYYKAAKIINSKKGVNKIIYTIRCLPLIVNRASIDNVLSTLHTRAIRRATEKENNN